MIAIAVLLMTGAASLLAAFTTFGEVVGIHTLALACAGPLQLALAVSLLRRAVWAVPAAILAFAANVVLCLSVGLMTVLTAGLGGDLFSYRGSGAPDIQILLASLTATTAALAILALAIRSAAGLTVDDVPRIDAGAITWRRRLKSEENSASPTHIHRNPTLTGDGHVLDT